MVFKFDNVPWGLKTIWYFSELPDTLANVYSMANKKKFDTIVIPFFPAKAQRTGTINDFIEQGFIKSEFELKGGLIEKVCIRLSQLDICVQDKKLRKFNKALLKQELEFAAYLGIQKIMVPIVATQDEEEVGKRYAKFLKKIKTSLFLNTDQISLQFNVSKPRQWHLYNLIRQHSLCNFPVYLTLDKEMPSKNDQKRWFAENITFIHVTPDLFQMNDKGAPILGESHSQFLTSCFAYEPQIILEGKTPKYDLTEHRNYLIHLFKQQEPLSEGAMMASDYFDSLQLPLQPYKDNLPAVTYEVFEQDQIKYDLYEQACRKYFAKMEQKPMNVLMAGAGRGGILNRVVLAAKQSKSKIIALEKNPYAYMTLLYMQKQNPAWKNILIINGDLKTWQYADKFDLVVSELLGSFGDNELSPECLGWAQHLLKEDAVSIPCDSVSYVVPVMCSQLHQSVRAQYGDKGCQASYVVHMHKHYIIPDIQECFRFNHPDPKNTNQLQQEKTMDFHYKQEILIHGVMGFFESLLGDEILLSIHPNTHTPDMFSWFSIYFPLNKPQLVCKNQTLRVRFVRNNNGKAVWYEWEFKILEEGNIIWESALHNQAGIQQQIHIE